MKPAASGTRAAFTEWDTLGHVLRMTVTGSIGLFAIFVVDFLSLLYVSWLGNETLTAAVGYASIISFLLTSVNIGFMIAASALAARRIGQGDRESARRIASSAIVTMVLVSALFALMIVAAIDPILDLMGAKGAVKDATRRYLYISTPSTILMALGMGYSGVLRAVGDANRAMFVTLAGGITTAVIDPILIFTLGLGIDGAALCVILSRLVFAVVGWYGAVHIHRMVQRPVMANVIADQRAIFDIALPAVLTNVATPISLAIVARVIAPFGASAMAANAVIDRLTPLAFGALFALSGAVGPILAQNWGAGHFPRMRSALRHSIVFAASYTLVMWLVLIFARHQIVHLFGLTGAAAEGVLFFCWISGPMWFFIGMLFTANAAFNNLGFALYSTAFNWGRATLGTIPFAIAGAHFGGFPGVLVGIALGSIVFGVTSIILAWRVIGRLERAHLAKQNEVKA
jgi:putative MATE family efflux protein